MKTLDEAALRRVKKCLALAKSANANEAATAMRHAQAIMREHGLSMADVEGVEVEDALVKTVEGYGRCAFLNELAGLLHDAFGVQAIIERNPGSANRANIRYVGATGRAQLAAYAHKVVTRAVDAAWGEVLLAHPEYKGVGGKRTAFRLGWLVAVRSAVESIGFSEAERAGVEAWKRRTYGGEIAKQKQKPVTMTQEELRLAQRGHAAGRGFRLHRPLDGEESTPLGIGVDR